MHWYLVDALAAGNHAMLKPSESTPRTSALLAEVLAEVFPIERVAVVQGGADVGAAFAASGGVNARNVARIAAGKFLNAGQTCIAPDDALVHEAERDAFVALLRTCVAHHYHDEMLAAITRALSTAPSTRLWAWLDEARVAGARVIPLHEGLHDDARRVLAPTVVLDAPGPLALMREETFGPVLPVMKYRHFDETLDYVNVRPRPLSLYVFDDDPARIKQVLEACSAGSAAINDCEFQFAQSRLPFGGVGPSGMGAYHGHAGFLAFSKQCRCSGKHAGRRRRGCTRLTARVRSAC